MEKKEDSMVPACYGTKTINELNVSYILFQSFFLGATSKSTEGKQNIKVQHLVTDF